MAPAGWPPEGGPILRVAVPPDCTTHNLASRYPHGQAGRDRAGVEHQRRERDVGDQSGVRSALLCESEVAILSDTLSNVDADPEPG